MRIVIIQTAFIGDVILCSSLVKTLSGEGHYVDFVLKPEAANLLECDHRISKLHVFDKRGKDRGISGLLSMSKHLRSERYDAALIPHRSIRSAALARFARIPMRIGFSTSAGARLFTHKVDYIKTAHEIVRNHALLDPLGISVQPAAPCIMTTPEDRTAAENCFDQFEIGKKDVVIGFGPGSQWFTKQWGVEHYRKLAELLTNNASCRVLCFGGGDEQSLGEEICAANSAKVHNAMGILSLRESAAALQKVRVVVSNDNGFMHLAAAMGKLVIAIFGPTVPEFGFAPWGPRHKIVERDLYCRPCSIHGTRACPEKHFRCMAEIEPEEVFQEVKKCIASNYAGFEV